MNNLLGVGDSKEAVRRATIGRPTVIDIRTQFMNADSRCQTASMLTTTPEWLSHNHPSCPSGLKLRDCWGLLFLLNRNILA